MYTIEKTVRYTLYPVLLGLTLATIASAIAFRWDYKVVYAIVTIFLVLSLMGVERLFPLDLKWSMTGQSFLRDLKYIALGAPTIALTKAGFGIWAISYGAHHRGLLTNTPVWFETLAFLLVFEFFQYHYHRASHEAPGRLGQFLWRIHVAHHLPDRVYVIMHAVFHPANAFVTAAIIQTPLILMGVSPEATLASSLLIDLQSLVSHFNVDLRAGFLNYILIGTETHRYHHSADVSDAGNYGNTLTIWDHLFGTFRYRPGVAPERLGVANPDEFPESNELARVLALPFGRTAFAGGDRAESRPAIL
jgi:sterol desaturase/sphingolipid hydroxylase (fatty acid hydroxylase superfamily)